MPDVSAALRVNLRHRRAEAIAAAIMSEISRYLRPGDEVGAATAILGVLDSAGAELITDDERAQAGLQRRDELGYTVDELLVIEARCLEMLAQSVTSAPDHSNLENSRRGDDCPDRRRITRAIMDDMSPIGSKKSLASLSMSDTAIAMLDGGGSS